MTRTVVQMLREAASNYPNTPYLWEKQDRGWVSRSFRQVEEEATAFASYLVKHGYRRNTSIAVLAEGRPGWVIGELGTLLAACRSVPLSIRLLPEEIPFRLNHSQSRAVIVSRNTIERVASVLDKITRKDFVLICLDGEGGDREGLARRYGLSYRKSLLFIDELIDEGRRALEETRLELEEIEKSIREDDVVTISYTSGTTGNPKGIMLTHLNYWANCVDSIGMFNVPRGWKTLLILPCDHSFAHTVGIYAALLRGISLYFVDARGGNLSLIRNIPANLLEANPDFLLTVPALSETFMKRINAGIAERGALFEGLFRWGLACGIRFHGDGHRTQPLGARIANWLPYKLADLLIFRRVRKIFGTDLKFFVGGGAYLDVRQQEFYNALGIPIYQGYGLTEAAPVISSNTPNAHKFGTSGRIAPTVECRVLKSDGGYAAAGEIGEVVIRGNNVMKGYFRNEKATAEALSGGWLHTGDLAFYDEDGFLSVVGREKALLISDDGEKYSPEEIEAAIVGSSDLVGQTLVYNDHRKYTTALVSLDIPKVEQLLRARRMSSVDLLKEIRASFYSFKDDSRFHNRFPGVWIPSTFQIVPEPFNEHNQMINSSMKMVRYRIIEAHRDLIEYMYRSEGNIFSNERNREVLRSLFKMEV